MPAKKEQPVKPRPANLVHAAKLDAARARREAILARKDEMLEMYMSGYGFRSIVEMLGINESPNFVRMILGSDPSTRKEYIEAHISRAHTLVEEAVDTARMGKALGDAAGLRVAADTMLKVAGKIAPTQYGDKASLELTGKDGGPVEANMTVSPAEAYEKLIKGKV